MPTAPQHLAIHLLYSAPSPTRTTYTRLSGRALGQWLALQAEHVESDAQTATRFEPPNTGDSTLCRLAEVRDAEAM